MLEAKMSFENNFNFIKPNNLNKNIEEGRSILLLDVRTEAEFLNYRIKDSVLFELSKIEHDPEVFLKLLDNNFQYKDICIICRVGHRASIAYTILSNYFPDNKLINESTILEGGLISWANEGYGIVKGK